MAACQLMPGAVGLGIVDSFAMLTPLITADLPYHGPEIAYLENGANGLIAPNSTQAFAGAWCVTFTTRAAIAIAAGLREGPASLHVENMAARFSDGILRALGREQASDGASPQDRESGAHGHQVWVFNRWVAHGSHIRCPMGVWFYSPHRRITLGDYVQFGPGCSVQCDIVFGSKILVARNVAFVGRDDHRMDMVGKAIWTRAAAIAIRPSSKTTSGSGTAPSSSRGHDRPRLGGGSRVRRDPGRTALRDRGRRPARLVRMRFSAAEIRVHERLLGYGDLTPTDFPAYTAAAAGRPL